MEEKFKGTGTSYKAKTEGPDRCKLKAWTKAAHKHRADGWLERT